MAEIQLSEEVRAALDRIDWSSLEVPRSVVEQNPKVAEQLAAGKPRHPHAHGEDRAAGKPPHEGRGHR